MSDNSKAKYLIFGGVGFIGRNLVHHLVTEGKASYVRVIDTRKPSMSFFGKKHSDVFDNDIVDFHQGGREANIKKAFDYEPGFDYVVNLACETRYGEQSVVYQERVLGTAKMIATEAEKHDIKKFIEISTGQVYSAGKSKKTEADKKKPWTTLAEYKLKTEEYLQSTKLPVVVLRAAIVYGPGDRQGFMPRLIAGRVYKHLSKKMKCLWDSDMKMNSVHVDDLSRAIVFACEKLDVGSVFNVVDKGETEQKTINEIIEKIFGIQTGFYSKIKSNLAKLNIKDAQKIVNDKHLQPWTQLLTKHKIEVTPLSPYVSPELLYDHSLSMSGEKLIKAGFSYKHPKMTEELIRDELNYALELKIFPPVE